MIERNFRIGKRRMVVIAEDSFDYKNAKTACGVIRYGFHEVLAVIDSACAGMMVKDIVPGISKDIPIVSSLEEALSFHPDCLLIGVAPRGGALPESWIDIIKKSIEAGLHIYNGLHTFLTNDPEIAALAQKHNCFLWDVRKPEKDLPVALGLCRNATSYLLQTVGSDCSVGKMTAALEIVEAVRKRGVSIEFVATGQTGILITGWGQPVDAIPGDFMAGAVEKEIMALDGKADIIILEGQGSLLHPGYSGVTLALLHGGAPDALIYCHQSDRKEIARGYKIPIPPASIMCRMYEEAARLIKPARSIAVCLNTFGMGEADALREIQSTMEESRLPTTDPVRFDPKIVVDAILTDYERYRTQKR
ncbi:MAG: DUF1611 domain-containing protein [Candidatus Sumerlaeota bacterium]|nr:DUF1611 domain-containing protein [Candidatus Sumerlaeota bacterium]